MKFKIRGGDLQDVVKAPQKMNVKEGVWTLKEDKWIMKCADPGGNAMFAALVPDEAMEDYEPGAREEIGVKLDKINDFIDSSDEMVEVKVEQNDAGTNQMVLSQGGLSARIGLIDIDYVEGKLEETPNVEYACKATGDMSFMFNFFSKVKSVVGTDHYMMSSRDDGIYLYGEKDNNEMDMKVGWDHFEEYTFDIDNALDQGKTPKTAEEKGGMDTLLSLEYSSDFVQISDEAELHFDDFGPMKLVFETTDGAKCSYILAPRIPSNSGRYKVPDHVTA